MARVSRLRSCTSFVLRCCGLSEDVFSLTVLFVSSRSFQYIFFEIQTNICKVFIISIVSFYFRMAIMNYRRNVESQNDV